MEIPLCSCLVEEEEEVRLVNVTLQNTFRLKTKIRTFHFNHQRVVGEHQGFVHQGVVDEQFEDDIRTMTGSRPLHFYP